MAANRNTPNQFGSAKPARTSEGTTCAQCEAMLPDWMDHAAGGELSATDRAAFELHIATCAECSQMLADAQRGAALLEMLKYPRPQPSSELLDRILANTTGSAGQTTSRTSGISVEEAVSGAANVLQSLPLAVALGHSTPPAMTNAVAGGNVLPFLRRGSSPAGNSFSLRAITHTMMQPRLAMTAAMAFFSIALTLNLTGVRLNELSLSDLRPANIRRTFYQADASVVRYYDNLRVVYELESRVQDMKRSSNNSDGEGANPRGAGAPQEKPRQDEPRKNAPKTGSGTSQRRGLMPHAFQLAAANSQVFYANAELSLHLRDGNTVVAHKLKESKQEGVLA